MNLRLLAAALAVLVQQPAAAATAPAAQVGAWDMSGMSDGDESCRVTLTGDETIGGFAVEAAPDCAATYPVADEFYAWNETQGGLAIYGVTRQRLLTLEPSPDGDGWIARVGPDRDLQFTRPRPPQREPTEQERMSGRWALTGLGGDPLCTYELTPDKAGMKGGLKKLSPCTAAWSGRNLARWERTKGRLILIDAQGKTSLTLPGDSIEGFFSPPTGADNYGFTRQWDDR